MNKVDRQPIRGIPLNQIKLDKNKFRPELNNKKNIDLLKKISNKTPLLFFSDLNLSPLKHKDLLKILENSTILDKTKIQDTLLEMKKIIDSENNSTKKNEIRHTLYKAITFVEDHCNEDLGKIIDKNMAWEISQRLIPEKKVSTVTHCPEGHPSKKDYAKIITDTNNSFIFNNYRANSRRELGRGGYGRVRTAVSNNTDYAVKKTSVQSYNDFLNTYREWYYLSKFTENPNDIQAVYMPTTTNNKSTKKPLRIIMPKGTPFKPSQRTTQQLIKDMISIAKQLHNFHRQGIVHNDLKIGNIVLINDQATIIDFGLCIDEHNPNQNRDIPLGGTLYPPEYMIEKFIDKQKIDIWAFGSILASIFLNCPTQSMFLNDNTSYYHSDFHEMMTMFTNYFEKVNENTHKITLANLTDEGNDHLKLLINRCLHVEILKRPTAEEIYKILMQIF